MHLSLFSNGTRLPRAGSYSRMSVTRRVELVEVEVE
jgi:hypothetical protein